MAVSHILHKDCPVCGKRAVEKKRFKLGEKVIVTLECGHVDVQALNKATVYDIVSNTKGYTLKPFQVEGIKFAEEARFRCLISDEQGLGKTVQALGVLKLHPELLPALIITKKKLKSQWFYELIEWCDKKEYLTQVLSAGHEQALPGFKVYVATYDYIKNENAFDMIEGEVNTLILDECQAIKNHLSGRAKACQKVSKITSNVVGLSGTPIKNNAGEYFTILNILQPTRFPEYTRFLREYCDYQETRSGFKVGGLKNPELFYDMTKDFIIRRTREEVAPELPKVFRQFHHVELDKKLNGAYKSAMKELDALMYDDDVATQSIIAVMTKMRKITGISKAQDECAEFVEDFLKSNERKIVIFLHHHAAEMLLKANLDKILKEMNLGESLSLTASMTSDASDAMVKKFRDDPKSRVLIASTLSAGEGLNLQFCSDAIMLERQWNPANEEQAEGRFSRFGSLANQVNVVYMIASGTIDEYFTELVEQKRAIVANTLDHKEINWDESSLMKELAQTLLANGKERWSL